MRTRIVYARRRQPFEAVFLAWSALAGASYLAGAPASPALVSFLARGGVSAWYVILAGSGALGLATMVYRHATRALLAERVALYLWGSMLAILAVAVFSVGARGILAGVLYALAVGGAAWRIGQIHTELHAIAAARLLEPDER